jgi:hypothetical protein
MILEADAERIGAVKASRRSRRAVGAIEAPAAML